MENIKEFISNNFAENHIFKALYSYAKDGEVKIIAGTHVDDIIWAAKPEYQSMIQSVIDASCCGEPEEDSFRYCGKEVVQDGDYNITVTCRDTTLSLKPIQIRKGRKLTDSLDDTERTQMKSIAGSLSWIARNCRPDLAYRV